MTRQRRTGRTRPALRLSCESLESRQMLAGDLPAAVEAITWQGLQSDVRPGFWNGRFESATPYGSVALPPELLPLPTWTTTSLGDGFFTLSAPDADSQLVLDWAAQTPGVLAIEPDFIIQAPFGTATVAAGVSPATTVDPETVPNDPGFALQWAPPIIQGTTAWSVGTGLRSVIVAVLDSGIDLSHPDLAGNVWRNPRELPDNGIDDEGNGFIDDVTGWNFIADTNGVQDRFGHGTHVSGIIGAVGNNGVGITGINWLVSLMPLKIISDTGTGTVSAALAALGYVAMMRRDFETNIVVTNNSWGTSGGLSVVMRDAIVSLNDLGVGFVAAAGNNASNNDVIPRYPSSYDVPNVIAVAASTPTDDLAGFSNYGATSVDLGAPGSSIYSTLENGSYGYLSGTSMAAPQVAGAYGLIAAAKAGLSVAEIRSAILGSTDTVPDLVGRTVTGGRLNIASAMKSLGLNPVTPPPPPPPPPPLPAPEPFADDFNQPDAATLSGYWSTRIGAIGLENGQAVSRSTGVSIATLNGVSVLDSASQAFIDLGTGTSVGLIARYSGSGDTNMYAASVTPAGTGFAGRIWRNVAGTWRSLTEGIVTASSGVLRFEVAGSSLTLLFNGIRVAGAFDTAITSPGGVGIRMTLAGGSCDNYSQATLTPPTPTAVSSPFADTFSGSDSPYVPGSWTKRFGNLAVASNVVVSRIGGVSLMALNGVTTRDSSAQAFVNVVTGQAVSLVARYTGTGDSRMYSAALVRSGTGYAGKIWLNRGLGWVLLASGPAVGGSGTLRFDAVGTALTLFLNGRKIAATSNRALTTAGAVGIRFAGAGSVADNYLATALTPPVPITATSPFADNFIQPDSLYLPGSWEQPFGNASVSGDAVVSRFDGASIARLYGVSVRDSSTQAVVNIGAGRLAGLVARYRGNLDRSMYLGGLMRDATGYQAGIWVNNGCRWSALATVRVPGGSGRIRFDVIGTSLSLYLNGTRILAVRDTTLCRPGAVGLRLVGDGSTVESFAYEQR